MKKKLLFLFMLSLFIRHSFAQDFPYGAITSEEMDMKNYSKDTSAHAVVLQEYGKSVITAVSDDDIRLVYEYHVKIKIFDSKAFDNGTVEIPVYHNSSDDSYETVDNIKGVTFFKDDNGMTQKIDLENKKIYPVNEDKHWANYKFALPGLRNGCVIEYKYTIQSPYWENFHSWRFQGYIPKIYSEYEVHIPAFWNYNASLKGGLKLTKSKSELERDCFEFHGAKSDCSFMVYGMKDIPAFKEEDFMTSAKNFMSAINFELVDYSSLSTGVKVKVAKDWKDVDYELKTNDDFGQQLKRKGLFKDRITPVIAGKTDNLSKAKAIYTYIQKWFKWNRFTGVFSIDGIGKALENHSGSIADINISLITALNAAGLDASPVLLSTRENGTINTLYPVIGDFNYVVAKIDVDGKSYLLDATDPLLPFGMLPLKCLNDKGRVFSLDKPSYWMDLNVPQKETSSYIFDLTLQEDGKMKGTFARYSGGYEGYKKRSEIKKFNSVDEYVEDLAGKLSKIKILKSEITNLDSLESPLSESYEVEIDSYDKLNGGNLIFNPYILNRATTNPFKLAERSFPVDWGMPSDERYIVNVHVPEQYSIEAPPAGMAIALPNGGGKFLTNYLVDGNTFTFSHVIQFKKSVYSSEEYPYLKELYNKIILSEKKEIVFKKK